MDDVETSARCLLAYLDASDPSPEQIAGAHLLAFGLVDLRNLVLLWGGK